jgi:hypothetical protein
MIRRISSIFALRRDNPALVFLLVFLFKALLMAFSSQPIPSNDSFFYDGAVVNYLSGGGYHNPAIALALPISGTEVFSAYPPLYQVVLLAWMAVFGTSVISAMIMHLLLFGIYEILVFAIIKQMRVPVRVFHLAGAFLLLITFHDRPDSVAHVFGMAAIYAWIRSQPSLTTAEMVPNRSGWSWLMALMVVLGLCTSLQIGGIYFLCIWIGASATSLLGKAKFSTMPMATLTFIPIGLVALVKVGYPHLWAGFVEHASQTPSFTGLRIVHAQEVLKVFRTVPAVIFIAVLSPILLRDFRLKKAQAVKYEWLLIPVMLSALAVIVGALTVLTANLVAIAAYLQPVLVAIFLGLVLTNPQPVPLMKLQRVGLMFCLLIGSVRAIGMSTWGMACAADVGYPSTIQLLRQELNRAPAGSSVVLSSPYLYEAAKHRNLKWVHCDWLVRAGHKEAAADKEGLLALKPCEMVLTQFDYYRRYQVAVEQLKNDPRVQVEVLNAAKLRAPDSFPRLQRIVQHVSWAPVVVKLTWKEKS